MYRSMRTFDHNEGFTERPSEDSAWPNPSHRWTDGCFGLSIGGRSLLEVNDARPNSEMTAVAIDAGIHLNAFPSDGQRAIWAPELLYARRDFVQMFQLRKPHRIEF